MKRVCLYDVLILPLNTEKVANAAAFSKYAFKVHAAANKKMVKNAVEEIFGVNVVKVNMIKAPSCTRVFKGVKGVVSGFKKAVVTLKDGSVIDYLKI